MKCPIEGKENAELLLSYSAHGLNPESAAILEEHMASCPACREFRDGQQALWKTLDHWEALPVSTGFDRRLYRRIEQQESVSWWARLFGPMGPVLLRSAPLAATACLILVAGFVGLGPERITTPVAVDNTQIREVEQVEKALDDLDMLRQFDLVATKEDSSRSM